MHIFRKFSCPSCSSIAQVAAQALAYFGFLLLAGYIFVLIEAEKDVETKDQRRKEFLQVLSKYNITHNNSMIRDIVLSAFRAYDVDALDLTDFTAEVESAWHLGSALFFTGTIITTIGYGNIFPKTSGGKSFCIVVALLGIPFTGFILSKIGVALTNLMSKADNFIEARIKQCFPNSIKDENAKVNIRRLQLVFVLTSFVVLFLLIPAAAFLDVEDNWSYFDSFYFCFISLTTIGLGDITPGASNAHIKFKEGLDASVLKASAVQVSVIVYLLLGLAALSIILALIGSIIRSAAEKTLNMGGKAFADAGGKAFVTETMRFATSIRKKTASTFGLSEAQSTPNEEQGKSITGISTVSECELEEAYIMTEKGELNGIGKASTNNNDQKKCAEDSMSVIMVNASAAKDRGDADEQSLLGSREALQTRVQDSSGGSRPSHEVEFSSSKGMQQPTLPTAEG